jgi:twinkle protein
MTHYPEGEKEVQHPKVVGPIAIRPELEGLWDHGMPAGDKTGWPSLDRHYTVMPGQITIVTGWPSSGKSEWLDALLVNLSRQNWRMAIFSPENQPIALHAAKLMEKLSGKPFGEGPTERLTREEVVHYANVLSKSFRFMAVENGAISPASVLTAAAGYLDGEVPGKRGLVIDPWNELEHWRPVGLSETEYISKTLSMIRNWARQCEVHVWIVAHPQKLRRDDSGKLPIPTPDAISGSAHFWNKADNALTVWRDLANPDSQNVEIHVQKVRFKNVGRSGIVDLTWDRITGRYHEPIGLRVVYGEHKE